MIRAHGFPAGRLLGHRGARHLAALLTISLALSSLPLSPSTSIADGLRKAAVLPIFVGKVGEGGGPFISPDFTPPNNSLLVMITFGVEDTYDVSRMMPVHNLAGQFTERLSLDMTASSHVAAKVWTMPIADGALSAAGFQYPGGQSVKGRILMLFAVTGYNRSDPIGSSVVAAAIGNSDGAMSLPGPPDARSVVVAGRILDVAANEDSAAVPGSGWTELGDQSVFERAGLQVQYRAGGTSPSIRWQSVNYNRVTNEQCGGFAIEIRAETGVQR